MKREKNNAPDRRLIYLVISICLISLILFILAGFIVQDESPGMKAGILLPLSGEHGKEGSYILSGIMTGANESGSGMDYIVRDTGGDPKKALEEIRELHSFGVDLIIGPLTEEEITGVADYAENNDMILILPFERSTVPVDKEGTVYRVSPGYAGEALVICGLINDLAPEDREILVVYEDLNLESDNLSRFENYTSLGFRFVEYRGEEIISYLIASGIPETVIWTGSPEKGAEFVKALKEYSPDTIIILSESSATDVFIENAGSHAEGIYGIEYPGGLDEEIMYGYYGRDSAIIAEEALAGGADTIAEIREEINSNVIIGHSGIKYFKEGGRTPPHYIIIKVENGTWTEEDEYTGRAMSRILAAYGGVLELDPLFNSGHGSLPIAHGIYD